MLLGLIECNSQLKTFQLSNDSLNNSFRLPTSNTFEINLIGGNPVVPKAERGEHVKQATRRSTILSYDKIMVRMKFSTGF